MILRRSTKSNPQAALNELTRDLGRIRSDLDNVRAALTHQGQVAMRDVGQRVSDSANRARKNTGEYVREHPGMTSGLAVGLVALLGVLLYVLSLRR